MSKESYIGGDYIETTGGDTKVFSEENIFNSSASKFVQNGGDGVFYGMNKETPNFAGAVVTFAYIAKLEKDEYHQIKWAGVEDEVYVVVRTTGLVGRTLTINILDRNATVTNSEYGVLSVLQDNSDKKGRFFTKVQDDGLAIFKLEMQPSKVEKDIKTWRDKIGASKDKMAYLCVLVDAHSQNTDLKVTYMGKNPASDNSSKKVDKSNYWLDEKGKWFELRRKNPVIIIDPGHGIEGGNEGAQARIYKYKKQTPVGSTDVADVNHLPDYVLNDPDKWIDGNNLSKSHKYDSEKTEFHLTYDIAEYLVNILESKGYKVFNTRTTRNVAKIIKDTDLPYRVKIANNKKADYFISIHADGEISFKTGAHAIYSAVQNLTEGSEIATDMMKYYTVVEVEKNSPKKDVRNLYVFKPVNKTLRNTLVEVGFVTTPKEAKILFANRKLIAEQLAKGLLENINKNF